MIVITTWKQPLERIISNSIVELIKNKKDSKILESFFECEISPYVIYQNLKDGILLYNTLTLEEIYLTKMEASTIQKYLTNENISSLYDCLELLSFLFEHRFFMEKALKPRCFADEVKDLIRLLSANGSKYDGYSSYLILPTTDCNARCFYCYEHGSKKIIMSPKTAEAVGQYILSKSKDDNAEISLRWFGGEPLMQISIIDQICDCLNQNERPFHSSIVSNGYLFNKDVIQKVKEVWHLKKAQITLDGPEDVYNSTKAYVNPNENPYFRVLDNIKLLAENAIHVNIRINYVLGQYEKIIQLINDLEKCFSGNQMISVYVHGIFQEISAGVSDQKRKRIFDEIISLNEELINRKLSRGEKLPKDFVMNYCMADNGTSAVILPDGRLTSCEHYNNEIKCWGSVFIEDVDEDVKAYWTERRELQEECETCFYYPLCIRLKHCPDANPKCYQEDRDMYRYKLKQGMLNAWEDYKKEHDIQEL